MGSRFWRFLAQGTPTLVLYGPIGADDGVGWLSDEVTPRRFLEELEALGPVAELNVQINSAGGDVFAGQAIHSLLVRHPARVTVHIDGLAASVASLVAMAGDRIIMPRGAMIMVHNPWTQAVGDAAAFRRLAETLDQVRESMLAVYESRTGLEREQLLPLLDAETWMTAEEAVRLGFADEVEARAIAAYQARPGLAVVNGLEVDLTRYHRPPELPAAAARPAEDGRAFDAFLRAWWRRFAGPVPAGG